MLESIMTIRLIKKIVSPMPWILFPLSPIHLHHHYNHHHNHRMPIFLSPKQLYPAPFIVWFIRALVYQSIYLTRNYRIWWEIVVNKIFTMSNTEMILLKMQLLEHAIYATLARFHQGGRPRSTPLPGIRTTSTRTRRLPNGRYLKKARGTKMQPMTLTLTIMMVHIRKKEVKTPYMATSSCRR